MGSPGALSGLMIQKDSELRKVVILMIMVYYSKQKENPTQIKISKGKRCAEKSPGEIRC